MKLSKPGAGAILGHEGIYLEAYRDPVGIWTIGAGHTRAAGGIAPRAGMILTLDRAVQVFAEDMGKYDARVNRALKPAVLSTQPRFDACVSFDFNTGAIDSGTVDDRMNRGDIEGGLAVFGLYVNAGGKRSARGLRLGGQGRDQRFQACRIIEAAAVQMRSELDATAPPRTPDPAAARLAVILGISETTVALLLRSCCPSPWSWVASCCWSWAYRKGVAKGSGGGGSAQGNCPTAKSIVLRLSC